MKSRFSIMFVGLLALLAVLVACQPQVITETVEVEVTRVVTETETVIEEVEVCLLYTSPSPRDKRQSRMPSSA